MHRSGNTLVKEKRQLSEGQMPLKEQKQKSQERPVRGPVWGHAPPGADDGVSVCSNLYADSG